MGSVLDLKIQGAGDCIDGAENFAASLEEDCAAPAENVARLHEAHLDLQEAIIKYDAIVEHLDRLWTSKVSCS